LVHRLGYPTVNPSDPAAIACALTTLMAAHESGTLVASASHEAVARSYDIRETTRALQDVLDQAIRAA
jgi:hypothetical protein